MRPLMPFRKSTIHFSRKAIPYAVSSLITAVVLLLTSTCTIPGFQERPIITPVFAPPRSTAALGRPFPDPQLPSLLSKSLAAWDPSDPAPSKLLSNCARANPELLVRAVLSAHKSNLSKSIVLDIGANGGYPTTRFSLDAGVGLVISAEPDPRNYVRLERLKRHKSSKSVIVRGAVSNTTGEKQMLFSKARDDFTCFTCLDKRKADTYLKIVQIHTVDALLSAHAANHNEWPVLLFKTDTQGHEPEVIAGAQQVLSDPRRVRYLIAEFDLKLLMKRERASGLLLSLLQAGFRCMHLSFSGMTKEMRVADKYSRFGEEISEERVESFIDFVRGTGEFTDLFCARK